MEPVLKTYYEALENDKILGLRCRECGAVEWPPVPTCNTCSSTVMDWVEIEGTAIVEEFSPVSKAYTKPPFEKFAPLYMFKGYLKEGTYVMNMVLDVTPEINDVVEQKLKDKETVNLVAKTLKLDDLNTVAFYLKD